MKVLHIGKFYPPYHGGMETYLKDLAQQQATAGQQVMVWVHNHDWGTWRSSTVEERDGAVVVLRQQALRPVLFTPIMLGFGKQIKQLIKRHQPDVLHLHWPNPSLFWLLFNKQAKAIPWVISWHSDMVTEHSSWLLKLVYRLIKPLESRLINLAHSVLVSSQNYADHSPQLKAYANKTQVIPLGMSTEQLTGFVPDLSWAAEQWAAQKFKLFHLGRLTFYKNQKLLIAAMKHLPHSHLLIAGGGQLNDVLQQQIDAEELTGQVALLGELGWQQVHSLFATCDVFCMASHDRAESFGVVLIEAMYHNKIILVPDTAGSGMQYLAKNYNKGFIYQADDVDDYVTKLNQIYQEYPAIMKRPKQFNYHIADASAAIQQHYHSIQTGEKT